MLPAHQLEGELAIPVPRYRHPHATNNGACSRDAPGPTNLNISDNYSLWMPRRPTIHGYIVGLVIGHGGCRVLLKHACHDIRRRRMRRMAVDMTPEPHVARSMFCVDQRLRYQLHRP